MTQFWDRTVSPSWHLRYQWANSNTQGFSLRRHIALFLCSTGLLQFTYYVHIILPHLAAIGSFVPETRSTCSTSNICMYLIQRTATRVVCNPNYYCLYSKQCLPRQPSHYTLSKVKSFNLKPKQCWCFSILAWANKRPTATTASTQWRRPHHRRRRRCKILIRFYSIFKYSCQGSEQTWLRFTIHHHRNCPIHPSNSKDTTVYNTQSIYNHTQSN